MLSLLLPVHAAEACPWLKTHGRHRRDISPAALDAATSAVVPEGCPEIESAGIVVRMPASWRVNRERKRLGGGDVRRSFAPRRKACGSDARRRRCRPLWTRNGRVACHNRAAHRCRREASDKTPREACQADTATQKYRAAFKRGAKGRATTNDSAGGSPVTSPSLTFVRAFFLAEGKLRTVG